MFFWEVAPKSNVNDSPQVSWAFSGVTLLVALKCQGTRGFTSCTRFWPSNFWPFALGLFYDFTTGFSHRQDVNTLGSKQNPGCEKSLTKWRCFLQKLADWYHGYQVFEDCFVQKPADECPRCSWITWPKLSWLVALINHWDAWGPWGLSGS